MLFKEAVMPGMRIYLIPKPERGCFRLVHRKIILKLDSKKIKSAQIFCRLSKTLKLRSKRKPLIAAQFAL